MSFVNRMTKEINCKIVYYGAGLCGKTANLNYIFAATKPGGGNDPGCRVLPRHG